MGLGEVVIHSVLPAVDSDWNIASLEKQQGEVHRVHHSAPVLELLAASPN